MSGRTGIVTPYRLCPRHGSALELVFRDRGGGGDNLSWWCADCHGEWSEAYFILREAAVLPVKAMFSNFAMNCPVCGRGRCQRMCDCSPWCLHHRCLFCREEFYPNLRRVGPPALPEEEVAKLAARVWLDSSLILARPDPRLEQFPQVVLESGGCTSHSELPCILATDHATPTERLRFGWICRECTPDGKWMEAEYYLDHRRPVYFVLTEGTWLDCPSCGHPEFDQSEDLLKPLCVTCGARYQISHDSEPRGPRGPRRVE